MTHLTASGLALTLKLGLPVGRPRVLILASEPASNLGSIEVAQILGGAVDAVDTDVVVVKLLELNVLLSELAEHPEKLVLVFKVVRSDLATAHHGSSCAKIGMLVLGVHLDELGILVSKIVP